MIKNNVLIVEDDEEAAELLGDYLIDNNFKVNISFTVTESLIEIEKNNYDLILLDLNLPDYNGTEVLKFLNKSRLNIPIIITSAYKDMSTKLDCFKYGASDYMQKPIDLEELVARMWVHLGKNSDFDLMEQIDIFQIINNNILFKNEILKLTRIEFDILSILIKNKNCLILRDDLLKQLSSKANEKSLNYHIQNIRKKIVNNDTNHQYLVTEYGMGYKLVY